jgi:hypothetical protein
MPARTYPGRIPTSADLLAANPPSEDNATQENLG